MTQQCLERCTYSQAATEGPKQDHNQVSDQQSLLISKRKWLMDRQTNLGWAFLLPIWPKKGCPVLTQPPCWDPTQERSDAEPFPTLNPSRSGRGNGGLNTIWVHKLHVSFEILKYYKHFLKHFLHNPRSNILRPLAWTETKRVPRL